MSNCCTALPTTLSAQPRRQAMWFDLTRGFFTVVAAGATFWGLLILANLAALCVPIVAS